MDDTLKTILILLAVGTAFQLLLWYSAYSADKYITKYWSAIRMSFARYGYAIDFYPSENKFIIRFAGQTKRGYRDESDWIKQERLHTLLKKLEKEADPCKAKDLINEVIGRNGIPYPEDKPATEAEWAIGGKAKKGE